MSEPTLEEVNEQLKEQISKMAEKLEFAKECMEESEGSFFRGMEVMRRILEDD